MRICVIGCGAVGSLFAAHLARLEEADVWAYDVAAEHVRAINERGLRISGIDDFTARVSATTDPAELPRCDYGIVATKSVDTEEAIAATARAFDDESAVCSVQNGLGNEEIIAEHVRHVIRGTTVAGGRMLGPAHVSWDVRGDTWIGPFEPAGTPMELVTRLAEALTRAGMTALALADARPAQWTKLIFNAATNAIGALTRLPHGAVVEFAPTRMLVGGLLAEGKAVAGALGIELDEDPQAIVDRPLLPAARGHKSSMLQDALARRPTEVDFLNGALVRCGESAGVGTPLNAAVLALVNGLERSWTLVPS